MRNLLLFITSLFLTSVYSQDYVRFSGKIINPTSEKLNIRNETGYYKDFIISEKGEFSDSLKIPTTGFYSFSDGRESSVIYLKNGYNLTLNLNTELFDETIKYSGKGSKNNNFLAQKYLINEKEFSSYKYYMLNENDFVKKIDSVKAVYYNMLKELGDKEFTEIQQKEINYDYYISLINYQPYHKYFAKDANFKVSDNFLKPIEKIDYNNENDYENFTTYQILVNSYYLSEIRDTNKIVSVLEKIKQIKSEKIKEGVVSQLMESYFNMRNDNLSFLYSSIKETCNKEACFKNFEEKYQSLSKLLKGNPSAKFSYKDINNKTVKLDDFKGKFVYIDVWATWCSPCLGEIPSLKKLEADYHDKNIVFISISVDNQKDYEKWKKMVIDKELKGYQLYADKSWKSDFIRAYLINSIPTFIFIDDNGNIISASATRPSNPKTREIFDSLLK